MSETATATAAPPGKAPGKKYAGLTRNQWLIVGGVGVAVLVWIVWKRRQAGAASQQQAGAGTTSSDCQDANGNPVPCDQADLSGELSALQTELETLMAAEGQSGAGSGGGGVITVPADTGTAPPGTADTTGSTGSTPKTGTGSTTKIAKSKTLPAPGGVHATKVTKTSITVAWSKVTGATGYRVRVTYQSKLVSSQQVAGTSATISGLGADHTYGVHVATVNAAGTGPEGTTDIKTSK